MLKLIIDVFRELHPAQIATRINRWVARQHSPIDIDGAPVCPRCREDYPCDELVRIVDRAETRQP
ncbi:MAG: hypothetical protein GEU78_09655 [Actinobacteria bacterium]|nr:hypothetical protein [Actinomycetota bacterium]